jgi:phage terminase small subunit
MSTEEISLGPAMLALTEKRRKFVLAMASDPFGSQTSWAKLAGYSDRSGGAKVRAWETYHDPQVQAAIQEVARQLLGSRGPLLATEGLLRIAGDRKHPQHVKALEMILNRTGMGEKQEIEVTHVDLRGDALVERLKALAARLGLDAEKLLGADTKTIEHRADELKSPDTLPGD